VNKKIRKAAILGSGAMGSGIAAQLANAGIRSFLLDIVPKELNEAEKLKGISMDSPAFRNRIAEANKALLLKSKPSALMDKADADLITVGNMKDNLTWLSECDWVVEAVPENLAIKKAVLQQIAPYITPGTIVTSNTSSISISSIAAEMPLEFRQYWLGTHFFNPVRYMKLLEIIPGQDTLPEVITSMADFGERVLGKGIVYAKETPAFVANRMGLWEGPSVGRLLLELGLTVPEADALTSSAIGRRGTGIFGLFDLVGIDITVASSKVVQDNVEDSIEKEIFSLPDFCQQMYTKGMLGNKTKGGFYKRVGKEKLVINVNTLEYSPIKPVKFDSLDAAKKEKTLTKKLEVFFESDDKAAQFVWRHMKGLFLYAASKIPEVSDDILNIDRALRWGFNHAAGPFELWEGLDLNKYIARMESEGDVIPAWVKEMLAAGINSFYKSEGGIEYYYSIPDKKYVAITHKPEVIVLKELKEQNKAILENSAGTLYDIGDGVICLQFNTKSPVITGELIEIMQLSQKELDKNWDGMVITGSGGNFCMGEDLKQLMFYVEQKKWDTIEKFVKLSQDTYIANKYSEKPVVAVVQGSALSGGCEIAMATAAIQASGETYMGLTEIGVGLIPAGGGIKELTMRALQRIEGTAAHPSDFLLSSFQNIASANVSTSAKEAIKLGFMKPTDRITLSDDHLLADAKTRVIELNNKGYGKPISRPFSVVGAKNVSMFKAGSRHMMEAGLISEYDWYLSCRIVDVMGGGSISKGVMINEQYMLDLERECFMSLLGQQKTIDRITHMLTKGKPLRN